jgi:hypothetical protein
MNVMSFGFLLERCKSKSDDLLRDKRQKGSESGRARSSKRIRKRKSRKENEEENAKGNEKGKTATEKREELKRFA